MKNKYDNLIEKLNYIMIIILIIAMPVLKLLGYVFMFSFKNMDILNFSYAKILWIALPIMVFITYYNIKKGNLKWNIYNILITILIITISISTLTSYNINQSIYGAIGRDEGLLTLLSYYLLMINASLIKDKKKIYNFLNILIILGYIQVIYAFFQTLIRCNYIIPYTLKYMASGLIGNPNFLGSYMVLGLGSSIGLYLFSKKNTNFYFISIIVLMIGLSLASSTTPFLGLICLLIFMPILNKFKKIFNFKKFLEIILIIFVTFSITTCLSNIIYIGVHKDNINLNYSITGDILQLMGFSRETLSKVTGMEAIEGEQVGSGRIVIWKSAFKAIPKYYLFGIGPDNFEYAVEQIWGDIKVDKAHNEYLQILITTGIFSFLAYMGLMFLIFLKCL